MKWLIVEDGLRNRDGHYFEYVSTFWRELRSLGDDVTVLVDREAEPFIIEGLNALPLLPPSIWPRLSDKSNRIKRYLRVPAHAWATIKAVSAWLRNSPPFDLIFVPSVSVHHLLGWVWLIKWQLRHSPSRVLLFFPSVPLVSGGDGSAQWQYSPTTKLLHLLLRCLEPEVADGKVILGAETEAMRTAMHALSGHPFVYLPHPVALPGSPLDDRQKEGGVLMACYGPARAEKGSDILQEAIIRYLVRFPESKVRFAIQWLGDFRDARGSWVTLPETLRSHPRVILIDRYFADGEYHTWLARTSVMLLPYRRSSYAWRLSRVLIEAMNSAMPVVVTSGTTLSEQGRQFGAVVLCEDEEVESLVTAIREAELNHAALKLGALVAQPRSCEHFSVRAFRDILLTKIGLLSPAASTESESVTRSKS